jgi:propanediol dehydratase small subunit
MKHISLDDVISGRAGMRDLRITPEALEHQARVAESAGRRQLAQNLRRAAELVEVPDAVILRVYNSLRSGRATAAELTALADEMENVYHARLCAALIRQASAVTCDSL